MWMSRKSSMALQACSGLSTERFSRLSPVISLQVTILLSEDIARQGGPHHIHPIIRKMSNSGRSSELTTTPKSLLSQALITTISRCMTRTLFYHGIDCAETLPETVSIQFYNVKVAILKLIDSPSLSSASRFKRCPHS